MPGMENVHALVIGIAAYRHIASLPVNVRYDAEDMHAVLTDPELGGYSPDRVTLLVDEQATRAGILQALDDLAQRTDPDSVVTIYLSAHGGQVEAGPHRGEYILPADVTGDLSDAGALADTAISGALFGQQLQAIPARKVWVILDCCHAGGIGTPKAGSTGLPSLRPGFTEDYYSGLSQGKGRVIYASARPDEVSYLLPGDRNSLFTKHLLAGLRGGVRSDDGFVRVFHLYEYVQPRVTEERPDQHPLFKGELEDNFPVALYRGGQPGTVPRDPEGFEYDAYISYAEAEPDKAFVWRELVPYLQQAGVRVAVSGMVEEPGVDRVLAIPEAMARCKRAVLVLTPRYFEDRWARFQALVDATRGIEEGKYRLLPLVADPGVDVSQLPMFVRMLTLLDITDPYMGDVNLARLVQILKGPLPQRHSR